MDGLDVYIGDYSQPDPIEPDVVRQMVQGRYIFDPPQTRVNAQGFVEDVPPEEPVPPQAVACPSPSAAERGRCDRLDPGGGGEPRPFRRPRAPREADPEPAASPPPVDPPPSAR